MFGIEEEHFLIILSLKHKLKINYRNNSEKHIKIIQMIKLNAGTEYN